MLPIHSPGHLQCQQLKNNTPQGHCSCNELCPMEDCLQLSLQGSFFICTSPIHIASHNSHPLGKTSCCYFLVCRISSCGQLTSYQIWEHTSSEQNIAFHHSPVSDASQNEMSLIHSVPMWPTTGIRERRMSALAHSVSRIGCIFSLAILAAALRRARHIKLSPPCGSLTLKSNKPLHSSASRPEVRLWKAWDISERLGYWHSYTQFGRELWKADHRAKIQSKLSLYKDDQREQ